MKTALTSWRELLHSRSFAASVVRVCGMVVLAQCALMVVRVPLQQRPARPPLVYVNTDDTAVYRNASHVNMKALVSLLSELTLSLAERAAAQLQPLADSDQLHLPAGAQLVRQLSRQQVRAVRQTLAVVAPGAVVVADDDGEVGVGDGSDGPEPEAFPLPTKYRSDVHKVVLFEQWLRPEELTVWVSPLTDSARELANYQLSMVTMSVCISYRAHPQLAVLAYPFSGPPPKLNWGLYGRGNDMQLTTAEPMRTYPDRFGINVNRRSDNASRQLALKAFYEDADLFEDGGVAHQLSGVRAGFTDAALYVDEFPLRQLCAPHLFLRLYGGRVTDHAGSEVSYGEGVRRSPKGLLSALYYYRRLLGHVTAALAGHALPRPKMGR